MALFSICYISACIINIFLNKLSVLQVG